MIVLFVTVELVLSVSITAGLNVFPLSFEVIIYASAKPVLLSAKVTNTLFPDAAISASTEIHLVELLKLILSLNVWPLSFDALNITS